MEVWEELIVWVWVPVDIDDGVGWFIEPVVFMELEYDCTIVIYSDVGEVFKVHVFVNVCSEMGFVQCCVIVDFKYVLI